MITNLRMELFEALIGDLGAEVFLEGGDPVLDGGTLIVPVEGEPGGSGQHRPGQQEELHPEHGHTWFFLE